MSQRKAFFGGCAVVVALLIYLSSFFLKDSAEFVLENHRKNLRLLHNNSLSCSPLRLLLREHGRRATAANSRVTLDSFPRTGAS